ncbi:MAG TPA: serine hydrolase domain-containing protein [Thermoanaerobaculia bacterium]|nr:serine hydrolase domain-containing protein [Thermoanaerobaculia bacterium]
MPLKHHPLIYAAMLGLAVCACLSLEAFSVAHVGLRPQAGQTTRQRMAGLFSEFRKDTPGAAVGVVRKGQVVFQAGYGAADILRKKPVDPDTAFHLASCGKEMTAAAILLLVQDGKLGLDDRAIRYLPEMRGWGGKVTIRQLLQNASGIPDTYSALEDWPGRPTGDDALRLLAQWRRLDFSPGSQYAYSDAGFDLLGLVVERVSGMPFPEFMQQRIFGPAGMKETFIYDDARLHQAKRARGYERSGGGWVLNDYSPLNFLYGSGEVYSTVADLARYDRALFGGGLLRPDLLQEMLTPGRFDDGQASSYAFGWFVELADSGDVFYRHSGLWMGYTSYYLHYPKEDLSVMVLSNSSDTNVEALAFDTAEVFKDEGAVAAGP